MKRLLYIPILLFGLSLYAQQQPSSAGSGGTGGGGAVTQSGIWSFRLQDGVGNPITSTTSSLDVNIKSGSIGNTGFNINNFPATWDIGDRAGRLLGVVYGSQGQQIKQTATNFNLQTELATGGTLYDARQIRALTTADAVAVFQTTGTNLHIVCDSGCSSSAGFGDNSAFTAGTTAVNPVGGVFNDGLAAVTSGNAAAARLTSDRALYFNLHKVGGTAITLGQKAMAASFPVVIASDQSAIPATQSGTWNIGTLTSITNAVAVTGTFWQATQPVSGTFWQATQPVSSTQLPVALDGSGFLKVHEQGTATVSGTVAATQSGTWTVQPGNTANTTAWKVDGSAVTQPVSGTVTATQATGTNLHMVCDSGCTPGGSTADNSAFTFGTTALNPMGAVVDDVATNSVTENSIGTPRMSGTRILYMDLSKTGANTNKLLVTPDSVALPANQSVNVSQINGVTPLMGNGTTGTGSQRVTIASDNTAFTVNAAESGTWTNRIVGNAGASIDAATGAAPPANAILHAGLGSGATGGLLKAFTVCDSDAGINISTATTTLLVTGVAGRQVRICSYSMMTGAADSVNIIEGTGATCGTGTAGMLNSGVTAATGYPFGANGGIAISGGLNDVMDTNTAGDSVCIITSAAVQLSGHVKYAIY